MLDEPGFLENVRERGEQLGQGLEAIARQFPDSVVDVRGWGLIRGLEIKQDLELTSIMVVKAAMESGLLLVPAGPKGGALCAALDCLPRGNRPRSGDSDRGPVVVGVISQPLAHRSLFMLAHDCHLLSPGYRRTLFG